MVLYLFELPDPSRYLSASEVKDIAEGAISSLPLPDVGESPLDPGDIWFVVIFAPRHLGRYAFTATALFDQQPASHERNCIIQLEFTAKFLFSCRYFFPWHFSHTRIIGEHS